MCLSLTFVCYTVHIAPAGCFFFASIFRKMPVKKCGNDRFIKRDAPRPLI